MERKEKLKINSKDGDTNVIKGKIKVHNVRLHDEDEVESYKDIKAEGNGG